ncbi:LytR/AlgR family response regulator transcription factor [Massilia antarctica]|uniref:LytR/AlgR family response regulator transcription factor n=1 Tax=Massilia antarctica TaxID=2765360 RepID=UPI0006BB7E15|nr:LytTR family DNA-binding domain-containing protein [Massilia sp. H27-R4]MCY0910706.1 LytTR family DNA-binding domain-containing protein [Massilia sp. H27-R4]CUI08920.1 two-component system response regulator protein [Janthinobacterium sp. CG23_2]CUU32706.1 two-component system response regulator protein [Janthinobacterium sp. CG23_2]
MRVIIVDDEDLARALVREFLASHPDIDIVAECADGFDAVKAITELAPDLVFLDIQMPKLNGFEVMELAGSKARTIFVTAFDQYALKAFDIHAVDYLLKPFSQQRFDAALAHARTHAAKDGVDAVLRDAALRAKPLERVLIRDGARVHVIAAGQIDYIEAQDDYVRISAGGKHYLKNQSLSELASQLDPALFVRIHRSWLLNLGAIDRIEQGRDSHTAILRDGTRLPVSRSGFQKLRDLIG